MCGFTGIVNFESSNPCNPRLLKDMNDLIKHRGPDDEGYCIQQNVGLGFRRLSIIDLEHGAQPMSDQAESCWVVFNGEIYNYKELRSALKSQGCAFRTHSDTEVIINAYKTYGEDCVNHLRGMFAFVIWDKINNKLFMARDRFGIKPLHYLINKTGVVFGSELKSVIKSGYSDRQIDSMAVDSFFTYGYILSPHTIYKDIKKLPPAHTLSVYLDGQKKDLTPKRYWQPVFSPDDTLSIEDYKAQLREKLMETVDKHLVSDVPVGAFLSGGIDSNSVVSAMSSRYRDKIKTFTVGFDENEFDESHLARLTAKKYHTDHHEIRITKSSALHLEQIIGMYDEPFSDSSSIPTYFVSRLAAQHVKVVLSGDGGDEFFGGYNAYQRLQKMQQLSMPNGIRFPVFRALSMLLPEKLPGKRFSYTMAQDPAYVYAYFNHMWRDEKKRVFHPDFYNHVQANPVQNLKIQHLKNSLSDEYLSRMMELDVLTYMPDDILTKVDRASMANSLEVRVPLIDHEFFSLAAKIPAKHKIHNKQGKYIFREAMRDMLPPEVYTFKKRGFTIPINKWFKDDLRDFTHESLQEGDAITEFIKPQFLQKLKQTENLGSLITRVWPMVVFNSWLNKVHKP